MTGVRFADVQARPAEFLNLTSLTLEEFEVLVAPFEAAFQGRRGASMENREPPVASPSTGPARWQRRKIGCSSCSPT
jgi:hypothetical protein